MTGMAKFCAETVTGMTMSVQLGARSPLATVVDKDKTTEAEPTIMRPDLRRKFILNLRMLRAFRSRLFESLLPS